MDAASFRAQAAGLGVDIDAGQAARFAQLLALTQEANAAASLTSDAGLADAVRTHFLDSLTLAPLIRELGLAGGRLVDVGSGGGFPGLPLKIALPSLSLTLIEASARRARHLERAADALGIDADVRCLRAEDAGRDPSLREGFDVATARAVGPWPVVLELTLPLCAVGGRVLGQRGAAAGEEALRGEGAASALGGRTERVASVGAEAGLGSRGVIVVVKESATPARFPRRAGIPAKRPLH